MDDAPRPEGDTRLGPPDLAHDQSPPEIPPGFVPLKLLLQPGGLCIEVSRPDMIVGRHSSADVRLCLPDVSRRHCRCVYGDGRWKIIDLDSLNGTFVNGRRHHEAILLHGDTIRLGSLNFFVDLGQAAATVGLVGREEEAPQGILRSIAEVLPERRKAS